MIVLNAPGLHSLVALQLWASFLTQPPAFVRALLLPIRGFPTRAGKTAQKGPVPGCTCANYGQKHFPFSVEKNFPSLFGQSFIFTFIGFCFSGQHSWPLWVWIWFSNFGFLDFQPAAALPSHLHPLWAIFSPSRSRYLTSEPISVNDCNYNAMTNWQLRLVSGCRSRSDRRNSVPAVPFKCQFGSGPGRAGPGLPSNQVPSQPAQDVERSTRNHFLIASEHISFKATNL